MAYDKRSKEQMAITMGNARRKGVFPLSLSLSSVPVLEKILMVLRNHVVPSKFLQDAEAESLIIGLIGVVL